MVVIITMAFLIVLVFLSPSKHKYAAMLIATLILSGLYFFFAPPVEYDLYREYEFLEYIKDLSFFQLFDGSHIAGNRMLRELAGVSNVYLMMAWGVSRLSIKQLLPFFVSLVVYGLSAKRINRVSQEINSNRTALAIAFALLILTVDFRSVSAIRNILAYALLAFTAYEDMVNKKNKILCFVGYFLICQIHMTAAIFVVIRILLIVFSRISKVALIVGSLLAFRLLFLIQDLLARFTQSNYISVFLYKTTRYVLRYGEGLAEYGYRRALSYLILILMYLFIFYVVKKSKMLPDKFDKYNLFYLSSIAITIGAIGQYDLFVRNCMIIVFLSVPYLVYACNYCIKVKNAVIRVRIIRGVPPMVNFIAVIVIFGLLAYFVVFFTLTFYVPMDPYFHLF